MELFRIRNEVLELYEAMGKVFSETQSRSGMHCPSDCGQCCTVPTVEASVLEMIPMAMKLYELGKAEEVFERIKNESPETCIMYESLSPDAKRGRCIMYAERPSVCRAFGVAGYSKKDSSVGLSVCRELKALYPDLYQTALQSPSNADIPKLSNWGMMLMQVHPEWSRERGPISQTLGKALEKVLVYMHYANA